MHCRRGLAALLIMLSLAGCAEGAISQGQTPYAVPSPKNDGDIRERGGM